MLSEYFISSHDEMHTGIDEVKQKEIILQNELNKLIWNIVQLN